MFMEPAAEGQRGVRAHVCRCTLVEVHDFVPPLGTRPDAGVIVMWPFLIKRQCAQVHVLDGASVWPSVQVESTCEHCVSTHVCVQTSLHNKCVCIYTGRYVYKVQAISP